MKRLLTIFAALIAILSMSAEVKTLKWEVSDLNISGSSRYSNNQSLVEETIKLNDYITLTFGNPTNEASNYPKYRTGTESDCLCIYSNNTFVITANNCEITEVSFNVDYDTENPQTNSTIVNNGWKGKIDNINYDKDNTTWNGTSSLITFTAGSRTPILGLDIKYTVDDTEDPGTDVPGGDDQKFEKAELWITDDLVTDGNYKNLQLADNGFEVSFVTGGTPAISTDKTIYFGYEDDYVTKTTRYEPGGNSSSGLASSSRADLTVPCDGKLYLYAVYNNASARTLQIFQDNNKIFEKTLSNATVSHPTQSNTTRNIFPIYEVDLKEGTATILWPDGQVHFYGFVFEPAEEEETPDPEQPEEPEPQPEDTGLIIKASQKQEGIYSYELRENGFIINFEIQGSSSGGTLNTKKAKFGSDDQAEELTAYFQVGSKSSNGVESDSKATLTVPQDGYFTIYAVNTQAEARSVQVIQNGETLLNQVLNSTDNVGTSEQIYPIYKVGLKAGTAYLLWPTNPLQFFGFKFEPGEVTDPEPEQPEEPGDEDTGLSIVGEDASGLYSYTLRENGFIIDFKIQSSSNGGTIKNNATKYFGDADNYETKKGYFQVGSKSNKGLESESLATLTVPEDGMFTIYAVNTSTDARYLQVMQESESLLNEELKNDGYVSGSSGTPEQIYPVYKVGLKKGTAYLLWPTNPLQFYGFKFEPGKVTDPEPEQPEEPEPGDNGLLFNANQVGEGESVASITLEDDNVKIEFTGNPGSAKLKEGPAYFGTQDNNVKIDYYYQPGGNSLKGISATNKGVMTIKNDGVLTIYAFTSTDNRTLQIRIDDENILFNQQYMTTDGVDYNDGKLYPAYSQALKKGTYYFLWPEGQLNLYGFKFEPGEVTDPEPEQPKEIKLIFTEANINASGDYSTVTVTEGDASVTFISDHANAAVTQSNGRFGTVEEYETLAYRYQPGGGKSDNGINSSKMGTLTLPEPGTLYIYAYNSMTDVRRLQILENGEVTKEYNYTSEDAVSPEGSNTKIYPVRKVYLQEKTVHLLYPDNQLTFYGFKFVPGEEYDNNEGENQEPGEPEDPDTPENPEIEGLFFTPEMAFTNPDEEQLEFSISYEDVVITFRTKSKSASIDNGVKGYFGTAADYRAIEWRYRPGGKAASTSPSSTTLGTISLPSDGKLTMFVYPGSNTESRNLQVIQDGETVFDELINPDSYETPEGTELKVYPVYTVDLREGIAYLNWPNNQVFFYGFIFEPSENPGEDPEEPEDDPSDDPEQPVDRTVSLFFNEDYEGAGDEVSDLTLADKGVSITFTSTSASVKVTNSNARFGDLDKFDLYGWCYQPGGKSENINSATKGLIQLPEAGTLYMYVRASSTDARNLQVTQNNNVLADIEYHAERYVSPEGTTTKIYPIEAVELDEGVAYLTWPNNQVFFYGFVFEPKASTTGIEEVNGATPMMPEDGIAYDLMGRRVGDDYKGIIILNGKKYLKN